MVDNRHSVSSPGTGQPLCSYENDTRQPSSIGWLERLRKIWKFLRFTLGIRRRFKGLT